MSFPKHMRMEWGKKVGWKCERCGRRFQDGFMVEFHHVRPTSQGGQDTYDNIMCVCRECHLFFHQELAKEDARQHNSVRIIQERIKKAGIHIKKRP